MRLHRVTRSAIIAALALVAGLVVFGELRRAYKLHQMRAMELALTTPGNTIKTDYICERAHASVDFNRRLMRKVDLRLTSITIVGEKTQWLVREAGYPLHTASTFPLKTGSIGGSEGIRWSDGGGEVRTAAVSFSDIVGPFGPYSLWIEMPPPLRADVTKSAGPTFTCGPTGRSVTSA